MLYQGKLSRYKSMLLWQRGEAEKSFILELSDEDIVTKNTVKLTKFKV